MEAGLQRERRRGGRELRARNGGGEEFGIDDWVFCVLRFEGVGELERGGRELATEARGRLHTCELEQETAAALCSQTFLFHSGEEGTTGHAGVHKRDFRVPPYS